MSIQVDFDLKEILNKIDKRLDKIGNSLEELKISQREKRVDLDNVKEDIKEIKGSQRAQIWTLIGILITAVGGFIVAISRSVLSFNP